MSRPTPTVVLRQALARWLLPLLCVSALTLVDCNRPVFVPYAPLEQKTELDEKKLYAATEGALLDRGYLFQKRDEVALRLVTKPRTITGAEGDPRYKYVWIVDTAGGTLKLRLMCQESRPDAEPRSCGDETPEKILKEQRAIADQAIAEARGD